MRQTQVELVLRSSFVLRPSFAIRRKRFIEGMPMLTTQAAFQHVLRLIADANQMYHWQLSLAAQQQYAQHIAVLINQQHLNDAQISVIINNYHQEHAFVAALLNEEYEQYATAWEMVKQQVRRILISKDAYSLMGDQALDVEDLVQETILNIWHGLPSFRYQSRLQTWVFTLASNCLNRTVRARRAQKRALLPTTESLELLEAEQGETLADTTNDTPAEEAQYDALAELVHSILARQPDQRLEKVFQLWAVEDQTLRTIGKRLELSVGRVHGLLAQAHRLLRTDPTLQRWQANEELAAPETLALTTKHVEH
jgi:RNA polymerase sigma factor (sigma-70 family)